MRLVAAAALLIACGQSAPIAPAPARPAPKLAIVTGRLVLRGAVIPSYEIMVTKRGLDVFAAPEPQYRAVDGRFRIIHSTGRLDLVFVGSGFARHIESPTLHEGINDLGDIAVEPGRLVEGHVTGPDGKPVDGATVEIVQAKLEYFLSEHGLRYRTVTDRTGYYWVAGVAILGPGGYRAIASEPSIGKSLPQRVSETTAVDIRIAPLGTIEVSAPTLPDNKRVVFSSVSVSALVLGLLVDHRCSVELPEGDYVVRVEASLQRVTVRGHDVTTVTFP